MSCNGDKKRSGSTEESAAAGSKKPKAGSSLAFPDYFVPGRMRVLTTTTPQASGKSVLYWMVRDQRADDNYALLLARHLASQQNVPVAVCFNLTPPTPEDPLATLRAYGWMLKGLKEVEAALKAKNVPFFLLQGGTPSEMVPALASELQASSVITDFSPLREALVHAQAVATSLDRAGRPLLQVDAHNIVPVWQASPKLEVGARTIRKKIHDLLPTYFKPFPVEGLLPNDPAAVAGMPGRKPRDGGVEWEKVLAGLTIDRSVKEIDWLQPGAAAGWANLDGFIEKRLKIFAEKRNDPTEAAISHMSPYFNFGQVSVQAAMLKVKGVKRYHDSVAAFVEEGVVRRELSDNFCFYQPKYDSLEGAAGWAQETLRVHAADERQYCYTPAQLEEGQTHDQLWNASQLQLVQEGKMHGFLRMYWAKKILEWTASPTAALAVALQLNDRYSIDGRDPNGFVGVGWSVMGVHDMGWTERKLVGKIRYMNYAGCLRKFDVEEFCARYPAAIAAARKVQAALSPQGEGPIPMKAAAAATTGDGVGEGGKGEAKGKGKTKK
ncbi:deoxyribodipyrimidine photo-lyase-like [Nannochloropsis oceanica]